MSKHKIIWTEKTWNVFTGCTKCSPGCLNCYAERMAIRLKGMEQEKYRNGFEFEYHIDVIKHMYDNLKKSKKQYKIFMNSMSDTFHEYAPPAIIQTLFGVMNELQHHTFQLLTKRPQNIPDGLNWTKNIHLGVTVCNQDEVDKKIPILLSAPAEKHFVSIEPMIESIDLTKRTLPHSNGIPIWPCSETMIFGLDLVIVGGESGPGARPMSRGWVRSVRDQCADAGVPFLFKQWGEWVPHNEQHFHPEVMPKAIFDHDTGDTLFRVGKKNAGCTLDGVIHDGAIL